MGARDQGDAFVGREVAQERGELGGIGESLAVEQDVETSLTHADRGYVMRQGRIVSSGPSSELLADPGFLREYLGVSM